MKFSKHFPNLAWWFTSGNGVEFGNTDYDKTLIALYDQGGEVWESGDIRDFDDAMEAAEKWIDEEYENE